MSYALASALQSAVFDRLVSATDLSALVDGAIYDAVPPGPLPRLYVTLGEEEAEDASDKDGPGARHEFTVAVVTDASGFARAKEAAGAVSEALLGAPVTLARGRLVGLWFVKARARRKDGIRRIDIRFRALTQDT